ncbi:MAG: demethylmenaquinone methyltransferase [Paenibacillaceae bacterium]|nr:demethylmenaquinone methyltransferase [Paenibacillaceae bacterium]
MEEGIAIENNGKAPKEVHDKATHVHALFERIAPTYDQMNDVLTARIHRRWRAFAMRRMRVQRGQRAVDLCCGTCDWTIALAEASQGGDVCGVDFSAQMLMYGKEKLAQSPYGHTVTLVQADVHRLPLTDASVDFATIGFGLRNVAHLDTVLAEMHRVLRPGGQAVCLDMSHPRSFFLRIGASMYLGTVMPFLAQLFVKKYREYKWLPESLESFPDGETLCAMFRDVGFGQVRWWPLGFGVAAVHIGVKR